MVVVIGASASQLLDQPRWHLIDFVGGIAYNSQYHRDRRTFEAGNGRISLRFMVGG